jgi:hypothetical protein
MCLSQTAFCPPGRLFTSENTRLITSIYPKEDNNYLQEISSIATCSIQMKIYLTFIIPKSALTGNILKLAKQDKNVPPIKISFCLAKVTQFTESETFSVSIRIIPFLYLQILMSVGNIDLRKVLSTVVVFHQTSGGRHI